tara:strand:- start:771 stop:1730 length:960 start_codon:yes stop_codon:yes gene_type:complete
MKIDIENPIELIQKKRPTLKENTLKQYNQNLTKLKKVFDSEDFEFLSSPTNVKEKLKNLHFTTIRNYLNAIIVLLSATDDEQYNEILKTYGKMRDEYNDTYNKNNSSGIISDKQKNSFVDISEINKMIDTMGNELKIGRIKQKKGDLTNKEKALLQVYILFNIYTRIPLRNDVSEMDAITKSQYNKLSEVDKKAKNFLVVEKNNMFFVLNKYKTSKKYEQLNIDIPPDLKKLLRFYLRVNGMGVLFKSSTGKPLSRNALSQLLIKTSKKYMSKSISTTMIRKSYLSSKYGKLNSELEKDNQIMGHSKNVALSTYVKESQ